MPNNVSVQRIDIPISVFVKVLVVAGVVYFTYQVLDVLAVVFVAVVLATALEPAVAWLHRNRIPRALSVLILYLAIFLALSLVVVLLVPALVTELGQLARQFPFYYAKLLSSVSHLEGVPNDASGSLQQAMQSVSSGLAGATTSLVGTLAEVFGGFVQFILMLVVAFYLVVDEYGVRRFLSSVTPVGKQAYVVELMHRIQQKLGAWLRGLLLLMAIIGLMTYLGLSTLNGFGVISLEYVLVLALWAGLTEAVPYVGPIMGAVPAVLLALAISPLQALVVLGLYLVIQQLENNLIVPMVMKRTLGLNPVVSIVAVLLGAKLGGVMGAIVAIPLATAVAVFLSDYFADRIADDLKTVETVPPPAGPA